MTFGLWEQDPLDTDFLMQRASVRSPEGRLVLAVLRHALLEYEKSTQQPERNRALLRELEVWFFADAEAETWPFSFENLCEMLELSPDWIRAHLARRGPKAARPVAPPVQVAAPATDAPELQATGA